MGRKIMNSLDVLFIVLCITTSINCFLIGCVLTYAIDYRKNKKEFLKKTSEYEKTLKVASESNNSFATKIIEIESRISDMSMFINSNFKNNWSK